MVKIIYRYLLLSTIVSTGVSHAFAQQSSLPKPDTVFYESNQLRLKGFLFKPQGQGPFPVYLWNHGSDKDPGPASRQAKFWTDHGFVFFAPVRSGHGDNPGNYIVDEEKKIRTEGLNMADAFKLRVKLHEKENDDVIAAINWIKQQAFTDTKKIVVAGGSYGGIQTLLTAERDAANPTGVICFIAMSPAAMSWSDRWAERLSLAVKNSKRPVYLMQAENDYNTGPSEILGPLVDDKGFPSSHKLFPPHLINGRDPADHGQGHGGFFNDPAAYQSEVLQFLKDCVVI